MTDKRRRLVGLILVAALALTACGPKKAATPRVLAMETGTEVATLGEEPIYLEEALFYTRMLQEQWEYTYYESFGETMWQQEASDDGQTLEELLKKSVMETLTELHLLCAHASEYGVELTDEEQQEIAGSAQNFLENNTDAVLEAAGADLEKVTWYLTRNRLAEDVAEKIQNEFEPEVSEEEARVGRLTYALFSVTGTYDAEGNHTAFTGEEQQEIEASARAFAARAQELGDITAAGEEVSHTVIDVYFNDRTNGGAHEAVADAARALPVGGVSDVIETEDGWYVVQHVSDLDEEATAENLEELKLSAKQAHLKGLEDAWIAETPLVIDDAVWDTVKIDDLLIPVGGDGSHS